MSLIETIINGLITGTITGFSVAIGSFLATEHLIEKIKKKDEK